VVATVSEFLWPGVTGFSRAASEFVVLGLLVVITAAGGGGMPARPIPRALPALAGLTTLATIASQLFKL